MTDKFFEATVTITPPYPRDDMREAAQQALEALECGDSVFYPKTKVAIAALRAALAEPVQEPVAWIYEFYADMGHKGLAFEEQPSAHNTPLYTAPPQRKPLTDEEIEGINRDLPLLHMQAKRGSVAVVFARAIERAHGIGGSDA